jgi:hypothetical protein
MWSKPGCCIYAIPSLSQIHDLHLSSAKLLIFKMIHFVLVKFQLPSDVGSQVYHPFSVLYRIYCKLWFQFMLWIFHFNDCCLCNACETSTVQDLIKFMPSFILICQRNTDTGISIMFLPDWSIFYKLYLQSAVNCCTKLIGSVITIWNSILQIIWVHQISHIVQSMESSGDFRDGQMHSHCNLFGR